MVPVEHSLCCAPYYHLCTLQSALCTSACTLSTHKSPCVPLCPFTHSLPLLHPLQVLRVVPYSAAQLYSYEVFKKLFQDDDGDLPVQRRLLAGACAGMTATLVSAWLGWLAGWLDSWLDSWLAVQQPASPSPLGWHQHPSTCSR